MSERRRPSRRSVESDGCGDLEAWRVQGPVFAKEAFIKEMHAIGISTTRYVSAIERGGFSFEGLLKGLAKVANAVASCGVIHLGEETCDAFLREHLGPGERGLTCSAIVQAVAEGKVSLDEAAVSTLADAARTSDSPLLRSAGNAARNGLFAKCVLENM